MSYKFHHIAIACFDIEKSIEKFQILGYNRGNIVRDSVQNVDICFLESNDQPLLELVSGYTNNSPITEFLNKNGVIPYHLCFLVDNIDDSVNELCNKGYIRLDRPISAVALENRIIVFMYSPDSGLIELVEEMKA